jgi:serine protease Do
MRGMRTLGIWLGLAGIAALSLAGRGVGLAQRAPRPAAAETHARRLGGAAMVSNGSHDWFGAGEHSWLGVTVRDVTAEDVARLKLPGDYGAIVDNVEPDSPAAKAGLEPNDVILRFDGERVRSEAELTRLVRETPPGRTVSVEISRGGQTRALQVTVEKHEDELIRQFRARPVFPNVIVPDLESELAPFLRLRTGRLGIVGEDLTPQLAQYFGVAQGKGVLVSEVVAASPAEKAGLKAGDCIVKVDSREVGSVGDLRRALAERSGAGTEGKRRVTLTIVRDRQQRTLTVELETSNELQKQEAAVREQVHRAQLESQKAMRELLDRTRSRALQDLQRQIEELRKRVAAEAAI